MLGITIEVVNAREFTMNLAGFASDVSDLTTVWPDVAPVLQAQTMEKFSTEGAAGEHGEWAELAPDYAAWKEKHFPGKTILQREGTLIDSFQEGNGNHIDRRTETTLEWGSAVPYAIYHQTGYRTRLGTGKSPVGIREGKTLRETETIKMANVPARRELDPSDEDLNGIRRGFQAGIVKLVRRRGFAIAGDVYGPGEMQEIGPSEAFVLGKSAGRL